MKQVHLVIDRHFADFCCPHCSARLLVDEWFTEYGEPTEGEVPAECPNCDETFTLHTEKTVSYSVSKNS